VGQIDDLIDNGLAVSKIPQGSYPREKEVATALHCDEARDGSQVYTDRLLLNRELARPIVVSDDRISIVIEQIEFGIVGPAILQELELPQ
jgi:hypothetical protein